MLSHLLIEIKDLIQNHALLSFDSNEKCLFRIMLSYLLIAIKDVHSCSIRIMLFDLLIAIKDVHQES